jgi:hypothetical protein
MKLDMALRLFVISAGTAIRAVLVVNPAKAEALHNSEAGQSSFLSTSLIEAQKTKAPNRGFCIAQKKPKETYGVPPWRINAITS